jgi:hypothetical protein
MRAGLPEAHHELFDLNGLGLRFRPAMRPSGKRNGPLMFYHPRNVGGPMRPTSGHERMVYGPTAASGEKRIGFSAGIARFGDILT